MTDTTNSTCGDHGGTSRQSGDPCELPAGWGIPDDDTGKCRNHRGTSPDGSSHDGNRFATRHGLYSDPAQVLDDLAENDPAAYEWVCKKYDSYLDDAPFDEGSAKADQLRQICAQEYLLWCGVGMQIQDGLVVRTHRKGSDGELVEVDDANPVNRAVNQLARTITKRLKELGVLDSPDAERADAEQSKADALRELMGQADDVDNEY